MDMSVHKRSIPGRLILSLVVGLNAIGCMVFASTSVAAVPPSGLNCVASDGKINGRGATFQERAQQTIFIPAYRDDFCGATAKEPEDAAGNAMIAYNYAEAKSGTGFTGSGQGLKAASCRTDAYAGTDIPYTVSQLKELNEKPGTLVNTEGKGTCTVNTPFTPPFQPNSPKEWPEEKAGKEDSTSPVMSFPVAGSGVAPMTNLTAATCGGKAPPTSLNFTGRELSRIFGGVVATWNDPELVATNPGVAPAGLEGCTGAVTRVVRFDNSGTTNIFKQYLIKVDNERTGATCAPGEKWSGKYFEGGKNTEWPGTKGETPCSTITNAGKSGNGELIIKLKATEGGIGYADLNEAEGSALLLPNIQNATSTSFQPPAIGKAANCDLKKLEAPPGITASEAVGLNEKNNWANDNDTVNKTGNHENATNLGEKFPICGVTFMLVYKGLDNGTVSNPISRLSADQRRTLYSYSTFILSSAAQELLGSSFYSPLPNGWLAKLRVGFQENF
jgi:ABC-type phosphate transport system substrate-binding protein